MCIRDRDASVLKQKDLSDEHQSTLNILFRSGVSPTVISNVMTDLVHMSLDKKGDHSISNVHYSYWICRCWYSNAIWFVSAVSEWLTSLSLLLIYMLICFTRLYIPSCVISKSVFISSFALNAKSFFSPLFSISFYVQICHNNKSLLFDQAEFTKPWQTCSTQRKR